MSHVNKIYDSDPHFTISAISRQIVNDSSKKTTLIQNDHDSERFSFTMPKVIEGHDMTECNQVEVHFINTGTKAEEVIKGVYEVKDLQTSPDDVENIVFSWLLSNNATKYEGKLAFLIRFACINADGSVDYAWHTAIHSNITISKGMNNAEYVVTDEMSDILAQWKNEIFGSTNKGVVAIEDAKNAALQRIDAEGGTLFANALKATASGEVVRVDDVSPLEHKALLTVKSKNILPYPYTNTSVTINGASFEVQADGGVLLSGTPTDVASMILYQGTPLLTSGIVTLSLSGDFSNVELYFVIKDENKADILRVETATTTTIDLGEYPTATAWQLSIKRKKNNTEISGIAYLQVEQGSTATAYSSFVSNLAVNITRYGADETDNLQTFTSDANGVVEIPSLSPKMTLLTDTEGVTIEMEYNQDTNAAMGNVKKDIAEADRVTSEVRVIVSDIETSLDNVIAKYELGGDV